MKVASLFTGAGGLDLGLHQVCQVQCHAMQVCSFCCVGRFQSTIPHAQLVVSRDTHQPEQSAKCTIDVMSDWQRQCGITNLSEVFLRRLVTRSSCSAKAILVPNR